MAHHADSAAAAKIKMDQLITSEPTIKIENIVLKHNLNANRDPMPDDGSHSGYSVGSKWVNKETSTTWWLVQSDDDGALWVESKK